MIRVVTLDREYACGGSAIAAKLAARLDWSLWDERLSREIAQRADCDLAAVQAREERRDPLYYRLLKSFLRGSFEASLQTNRLRLVDADRIAAITEQLVCDVATEGRCVIVGRGAQYFLQDREDTYHVFLYAPYEHKLRREQAAGRSAAHAAQLLAATDRDRAAFIRAYFGKPWPTRARYDLMVNSKAGDDAAVETILAAIDVRERLQER
jgi:cytidylate kinase